MPGAAVTGARKGWPKERTRRELEAMEDMMRGKLRGKLRGTMGVV